MFTLLVGLGLGLFLSMLVEGLDNDTTESPVFSAHIQRKAVNRDLPFPAQKAYSFLHISKSGGSSFIAEAHLYRNVFPDFYPQKDFGQEHGALFDLKQRPDSTRLLLLRSPRSHMMSLFKECRYTRWGVKLWHNADMNNELSIPHNGTHEGDFEAWIDHYLHPTHEKFLGCYNPWNFQSHFLTAATSSVARDLDSDRDLEPDVMDALGTIFEWDFVGITDFYHESKCLLYSRLPTLSESKEAEFYYNNACTCDTETLLPHNEDNISKDMHIDHGGLSSEIPLSSMQLTKIDRLTESDRYVFEVALRTFFTEMKALEERVGYRILCEGTIEKAAAQLKYIHEDLVALYDIASPDHKLVSVGPLP